MDYSTEPQYRDRFPTFLIGDLSGTVTRFFTFRQMHPFYKLFPLHDIIGMLLSISVNKIDPGTSEYIMDCTERALGNHIEQIDTDGLFLFYEQLTIALDEELNHKTPDYAQNQNYVFYRWLDPISICLLDDTKLNSLILPEVTVRPYGKVIS